MLIAQSVVVPDHDPRWLALITFGAVLVFVGLVWTLNLFGVADEHARLIRASRVNRWLIGEARLRSLDSRTRRMVALVPGAGFMVFGVVIIVLGLGRLL